MSTRSTIAYGKNFHIWEAIRHLGGARLDLVDKTDQELLANVEADVDRRIDMYREALRDQPDRAGMAGLAGMPVYGEAESPREEQIRKGMEYYRKKRQHQQEVQAAIVALREAQFPSEPLAIHSSD